MSKEREKHGEIHNEKIANPEVYYEHQDLSARGIIGFLVGLIVTVALIHLIVYGLYKFMASEKLVSTPRSAGIITPNKILPQGQDPVLRFPQPVLQPDPAADLDKFRATNEQQLNTYGYVDQGKGVVHIPIERAIDIVAQQGLPTRQQPQLPPHAQFGTGTPTVAGGGGGVEPVPHKQ